MLVDMHLHVLSCLQKKKMVAIHFECNSDEIFSGVLQFKENVSIVFVSCASYYSPQTIIRECEIRQPWWSGVL
jgi:hypothetical protein